MLLPLAFLLLVPATAFTASIISSIYREKHIRIVNVVFSILLMVAGIFFYATYIVENTPKEHIVVYSASGLGEIYGFIIDPLSSSFALIISIIAGVVLLYSTDYMTHLNSYHPVVTGRTRFYAWMYLFVLAVLLFVFSSNLVQLLINFELMSLACWGLISYYGGSEAIRSSFKMLVITHLGAYGGLGAAIGYLIYKYGTVSLSVLDSISPYDKLIIIGLIMWAAITKSSQFPTYSWLPDAMVAPTPTSALLHGATMIEMGPYLLARILYAMGNVPYNALFIILVPVILSLIVSTLMYPVLKDGKRLLAYSTIAEASIMYFTLSVSVYSIPLSLSLFSLYFTVHAFLKSLGFLLMGCAGFFLGTHSLDRVMGFFGSNKLLYNLIICVLFGLAGVPLYSVSKIYVIILSSPLLDNPLFICSLIAILIESLVLIAVAVYWIGKARDIEVEDKAIPFYMLSSFIILLVGLYLSQILVFTTIMPSIYEVM